MGFYYDDQLNIERNTVKLWADPNDNGDYSKVIARALYNEDFEFEIANSWSDFNSGNPLESAWNNLKPFAGYMDPVTNVFSYFQNKGIFKSGANDNSLVSALKAGGRFVSEGRAQGYLNKALVVQGTRFIYFMGTDITMGNMQLKYTIMYDPVNDRTVQDQLKDIIPYAVGEYNNLADLTSGTKLGSNSLVQKGGQLIGWQDPPGTPPYEANYENVDKVHKGTLKLEFGNDQFVIDNLVVKTMNVLASKVHTKRKTSSSMSTPLYADITLTFQPAGIITRKKLLEYLRAKDV